MLSTLRNYPVPLFHFHVADAHPQVVTDPIELSSIDDAKRHALRLAGQSLCDEEPIFWDADPWVLTVSDERQLTLFTLTVVAANAASLGCKVPHPR